MDAKHGNSHIESTTKTGSGSLSSVTAPGWRIDRSAVFHAPTALKDCTTCDTVILGGGIVGLALAYNLSRFKKVVLLESKEIASGSSGWNAGILSLSTTLDLAVLGKMVGEEQAKLLASCLTTCLDETRKSLALGREVWQTGRSLFVAAKKTHEKLLDEEQDVQTQYGFASTLLSKQALQAHWKGFASGLALEHEHAVHPYRLLLALAKAAEQQGAEIFEYSPATSWNQDDDGVTVEVGGLTVRANNLVVATGVAGLERHFDNRITGRSVAVTGQILVTKPSSHVRDLIAKEGAIALWDSLKFYHYIHYLPDGRMLVGGGDSPGRHKSTSIAHDDAGLKSLFDWAAKHHSFPIPEIDCAWRASLIYPLDGLPLIATKRKGASRVIHAVTDGLPFGMLFGRALSDVLSGQESATTHEAVRILEDRKAPQGAAGLLTMLPNNASVRNLAVRIGMIGLKLQDLVV